MSEPIEVEPLPPFQNQAPTEAPKSRNGIVLHWGDDREEFIPDPEEIE